MKNYLSLALALAFIGLVIAFIVMKRGDNAQHETDAGAIADYSNRLDTAQIQIAACKGTMLTLSKSLDERRSAALTFSNQLMEAKSAVVLGMEQITNLNRRVAEVESENQNLQTLGQRVMDLTNQVAGLTAQIALAGTNLDQANKDYALLENRLRRDVAERVVVERKFYNLPELQTQLEYMKTHPGGDVSAESIYAGLDVEVRSNAFHVIAPN
jgi:chromosome segregation ATPase